MQMSSQMTSTLWFPLRYASIRQARLTVLQLSSDGKSNMASWGNLRTKSRFIAGKNIYIYNYIYIYIYKQGIYRDWPVPRLSARRYSYHLVPFRLLFLEMVWMNLKCHPEGLRADKMQPTRLPFAHASSCRENCWFILLDPRCQFGWW